MRNIWLQLSKPILIQAPMENVTDTVFRQIIARCGKPDMFFTEFVSCDGLISPGGKNISHMLKFDKTEKPVIAQIWGNNPHNYILSVRMIKKMGFAGIDINMGCPDRNVVAHGCCSGLINNPSLASKIYKTTKEEAGDLPVSIKTRYGYRSIETERWIGFLLGLNPAAIIIHGRTARQMSKGSANWEEIGKAVNIRNRMKSDTLIIGNGDVLTISDAYEKYKQYGVDGIMIGRGIFHNLWIYNKNLDPSTITVKAKLKLLLKHIILFDKTWGTTKNFQIMKKFYRSYISGFDGASDLRIRLMDLKSIKETIICLNRFLQEMGKLSPQDDRQNCSLIKKK